MDLELANAVEGFEKLKARRLKQTWDQKHGDGRKLQKSVSGNREIRAQVLETGELDPGVEYWITYNALRNTSIRMREDKNLVAVFSKATLALFDPDKLNGYVYFPKRESPVKLGDPLLKFIPVHGGITWAVKDSFGCVFGFDTAHAHSDEVPFKDREWIRKQCNLLYHGLLFIKQFRQKGKKMTRSQRLEFADNLRKLNPDEPWNMEIMIGILTGSL